MFPANILRPLYPVLARLHLRSYIAGLLVVLIGGGGYMALANGDDTSASAQTFSAVERRTISSGVKAVGKVTFANEQQMKFNQKGTVTKVAAKEGDNVKKGQIIAELDTSAVMSDIRQAQLAVGASNLQLQQMQSDRQKTIADAQDALNVSQEKLPSDLASAQRAVTEKEAALKQAQAALSQARVTALEDLGSTAQNVLSSSEGLLDTLYGILVNDLSATIPQNQPLNIYYRLYNNQTQKIATEGSYYAATQATTTMRAKYGSTLASQRDSAVLLQALDSAYAVATAVHQLADNAYQLVMGASDDPHDFTVDDIKQIRSSILSARSSAAGLMTSAQTAKSGLTGGSSGQVTSITVQQKEDAVETAQHSLEAAKENLKVLQTQTPGDLRSKQQALDSAVTSTDINIKLKQNDVAQRAASLQKTQKVLQDYRLIAPFDGVVSRMDFKVGDNLLADTGEEKYAVLQNADFLVVTIQLDQVDIVKVKTGQAATIVFDALPDRTFTGDIYEINSTPIESSGVVSYEVSVRLQTPKDLTILSGMTATVNIVTLRKENVLAVPNLALQRTNNAAIATLSDGRSVTIEAGATDGRFTEVLSGLQEGDQVVSLNTATVQAAGTQGNQQIFRLGGQGGGGGGFGAGAAVRVGR